MASFVVLRCNTVCGYASLHAPSRALHINLTPRCVSAVMVPPPGLSRMQLAVWQATAWKGHRGVNWKTCTTICLVDTGKLRSIAGCRFKLTVTKSDSVGLPRFETDELAVRCCDSVC